MTDKIKQRIIEKLKENHCRYCENLLEYAHPALKGRCENDIEELADQILKELREDMDKSWRKSCREQIEFEKNQLKQEILGKLPKETTFDHESSNQTLKDIKKIINE